MQPPPADERRRRFELLALPHLDAACNLARWLAGTSTDAEDVVQDAYLRAYRYFDSWQGEDFRVWLLTIVRNSFLAWAQKNRGKRLVFGLDGTEEDVGTEETAWASPPMDPERLLICRAEADALERLVQALPAEYREVLVLRELEDLSYQEIAKIVGAPIGTVMSRLARARAQLRRRWCTEDTGGGTR